MATDLDPFSADGFETAWTTWDGDHRVELSLRWDNEAWTASMRSEREAVECVFRISPTWQLRQFLLFRDLDEPDLWLGTDGHSRWGELNGAHRPELDGCVDLDVRPGRSPSRCRSGACPWRVATPPSCRRRRST